MILLLAACSGPPATDDSVADPSPEGPLSVTLATVSTVLDVRWETTAASTATVTGRFGDESVVLDVPEAATEHAVFLTGFPPLTEVTVTVEIAAEDGTTETREAAVTTGSSPSWVPDLTVTGEAADGGITLVPVILATGGGILGLDAKGRVVWAWPQDDDGIDGLTYGPPLRTRLSLDGGSVLYNRMARSVSEEAPLTRVSIDGGTVEEIGFLGGHTDFVEYTPGGYAMLGWDIREVEPGREILGDTILVRTPDGEQSVLWNAWDWYAPDLETTYEALYPADLEVEDWTHINGIHHDTVDDAFLVTMTFDSGVAKIDRETGELRWTLAAEGGDFAVGGDREPLDLPHSVMRIGTGDLLVFNRGDPSDPDTCSNATEIALDEDAREARSTWSYASPDCLLVPYLGSAERLSSGDTLISWTTAGRLDEVDPDGTLVWSVSSAIGAAVGFSTRVDGLGPD